MIVALLLGCSDASKSYQNGPFCDWTVEEIDASADISCANNKCWVPEGDFIMGSSQSTEDQCPPHHRYTEAYEIDQREVTRGAYDECLNEGQCSDIPNCPTAALNQVNSQLPVTCITWHQAEAYCNWKGGRLPTEAEWEKAARGPNGMPWPWGETPPNCAIANFRYASSYCAGGVIEVGSYRYPDPLLTAIPDSRSAYGLLDVAGNAWEWTSDDYDARSHESAALAEDESGCALNVDDERGECFSKVIKGGGFNTLQDMTRTSSRAFLTPDGLDDNVGFRCAYSLD